MNEAMLWEKFYQTGRIDDYMNYLKIKNTGENNAGNPDDNNQGSCN